MLAERQRGGGFFLGMVGGLTARAVERARKAISDGAESESALGVLRICPAEKAAVKKRTLRAYVQITTPQRGCRKRKTFHA